jgi:Holliday junction DNA helicase RuvB
MEGGVISGKYGNPVPPWTLLGATTRTGRISAPIRDRFGLKLELSYYPEPDIAKIVTRSGEKLNMNIRPQSASEVATRARGVPRIANRLLRRVRDVYDNPTKKQVDEVFVELGVDSWGFESCDRALLMLMYERFGGGPVGLKTLAAASGYDPETLSNLFEPYMLRVGLIDVAERGRQLTVRGYTYCKLMQKRLGRES